MTKKPIDQLGELQRAVLEVLWDQGQATVQQVVQLLKPKRRLAYTTVLTTLQNLTKAGWARHEKEGRAYVYYPTRTRDQAEARSIRAFVKRTFGGNSRLMLQTLLEADELSDEDLTELKRMIEAKRKGK